MAEGFVPTPKRCAHEGCDAEIKGHAWAVIKAEDWFFQKDGTSWCPDHLPDWVPAWRARQAAKKTPSTHNR